jgi:polar amino acid transport system substrate-binding protein
MKRTTCVKSLSISFASLVVSMGLFLGQAYADSESTMTRIERTKVLRVGVINGAIPYFNKDLASGEWGGFGPDFSRDLAKDLGVKLEFVETTWGNSVLDLQANKIDAMFALAPTPARRGMVGFSDPLFNNTYTMVCKPGYPDKSWDQFNAPDAKISVDLGSSMDNFATEKLPNASISRLDSTSAATMALQAGRVDCQVLTVLLAQPLLKKMPDIGSIHVPTPVLAAPVTVGIQIEKDPRFMNAINTWLAKEKTSGEVRKVIIGNMQKLAGIDPASFPASVKFE